MRRIKVQINGIRDLDLLSLKYNKEFSMETAIYTALRGYVLGEGTVIHVPESKPSAEIFQNTNQKPWVAISLDEEKDKQILAWYDSLPKGRRAVAIKCILRNYLSRPYLDALYLELPDTEMEWKIKKDREQETKAAETLPEKGIAERTEQMMGIREKKESVPMTKQTVFPSQETEKKQDTTEPWDLFGEDGFVEIY